MEKEKKGIFSRLKLIYIVITLLAGATILTDLAISVFWVSPFVKDLEEKFLDYELIQAKRVAYVVENFIDQTVRNSEEIAATIGTVGEKTKETEYILARFLRDNPDIRTISIIDAGGQEIKKTSILEVFAPADLKDLSGSVEFIYAATKELYISPVYFSQNAEPYLTIAAPIFLPNQERAIGVLRVELNLRGILSLIPAMQTSSEMRISVVDDEGNLIADPDFSRVLKGVSLKDLAPVKTATILEQDFKDLKNGQYLNEKGEKVIGVAAPIKKFRWGVIIEEPVEKVLGPGQDLDRAAMLFIAATMAMLVVLIWLAGILSQTNKELKQKYIQLEFQKNELDKTTGMLVQKDLDLSETRDWLREALVKSDKGRISMEDSRAALLNMMEDAEEARLKAEESGKALLNLLEDTEETRKTAEEEKNKTQAIIVNFTDGLLVFDPKDRISLINPQAEIFFGIKTEQVIGKHLSELENFPALKPLFDFFGQEIKKIFREELILNENLIVEVVTVPILRGTERTGTLVIIHDVTREKMIAKTKSEFISLVAHQLRAPLSGMKWILRMLLDGDYGPLSGEQKDIISKGYESNYGLINLVNDLLDVARLEEGRFGFDFSENDFNKALTEITDSFEEDAKKARVILLSSVPRKPLIFVFDLQRMKMVFSNLVANAIRYTKAGGQVLISSKMKGGQIEVAIKDTGVGIPHRQKERVFTKFFRGDNVVKMQAEGSGLGLYLAKNIVEKHGGKIWFETEEGRGSIFYFTIPMK